MKQEKGAERKTRSLNRTILGIVLFGYCTLMFLLVCMDYFLIARYQAEKVQKKQQALEYYTSETANGLEQVRMILYDIYMHNEDFEQLSKNLTDAKRYSHAYDLRQTLNSHMMLNQGLEGFYIFYNPREYPLYQINDSQVAPEHARRMAQALLQMEEQKEMSRGWFCVTIEKSIYLVMGYRKGYATIYGIRNLGNAQAVIREKAEGDADICLIDNGRILVNQEAAEKYGIQEEISHAAGRIHFSREQDQIMGERIGDADLWICAVFPGTFRDYISLSLAAMLILTVCSVALAFGVYSFLRKNLVSPLKLLRNEMEKIRNDAVKNVPRLDMRFTELKEVNETLQEMVTKLEKQRVLAYDALIEKQKAQMQYLQLQMQPHFYLNGLKALNALVMENEREKVQSLIINLSEHLRYLLQAEAETTTLGQELDFTDNYVKLRGQMTGRVIRCRMDAENEAKERMVPMLAVQTFVENSIKYAKVGSTNAALVITVKVALLQTEEGEYLDIVVTDNGQGYPAEVLKEINEKPKAGTRSIGISNLKRRCQILYGEMAEFTFFNREGAVSECILPGEVRE